MLHLSHNSAGAQISDLAIPSVHGIDNVELLLKYLQSHFDSHIQISLYKPWSGRKGTVPFQSYMQSWLAGCIAAVLQAFESHEIYFDENDPSLINAHVILH